MKLENNQKEVRSEMPAFSRNHIINVNVGDLSLTDELRLIRFMIDMSLIKVFLILQFTGKILFTLIHLKIKKQLELLEENSVFKRETDLSDRA